MTVCGGGCRSRVLKVEGVRRPGKISLPFRLLNSQVMMSVVLRDERTVGGDGLNRPIGVTVGTAVD
jgi:hypothetical protein